MPQIPTPENINDNIVDIERVRKTMEFFSKGWVLAHSGRNDSDNSGTFQIIAKILNESIIEKIEEHNLLLDILDSEDHEKFDFKVETIKLDGVLARIYMDIYPDCYFKAATSSLFSYYNTFNRQFYDLKSLKDRKLFEECQQFLYDLIEKTLDILVARVESYYYGVKTSAIETLLTIMKYQDKYTRDHTVRVGYYSDLLAKKIFNTETSFDFKIGSQLHDIGKIGIPQSILQSPNRLSEADFAIVKEHPSIGAEILTNLTGDGVMIDVAKHHHERWDGTGYPSRLAKENIPLPARIIGVIDAFDAMTTVRSYCVALPVERALEEIKVNKEKQFDPDIADIFLSLPFELLNVKPM